MSTSNDILDAACICLVRNGGRQIALAEVAREAGVSRPTVYRRWPEVSSVIRDLLTREVARIIAEHRGRIDDVMRIPEAVASTSSVDVLERGPSGRGGVAQDQTSAPTSGEMLDALVETTVAVAVAIGRNAVFECLGRTQPEVIAPYIFTRLGASQRGVLAVLTDAIAEAQSRGAIRDGRTDHLAAMVLLMAQSAVQSRSMMAPILGDAWDTELRAALIGYLAPPPTSSDHRPHRSHRTAGDPS